MVLSQQLLQIHTGLIEHKSLFSPSQGTIGFEQHIDKCLDLSQYLYNKIKNREGYEMVFDGVVSLPNFLSVSVLFPFF